MKNGNDPIKQENKKAMPKFILIFAVCLAIGLVLGFVTAWLDFESFGDALSAFGTFYASRLAGWLLCACLAAEFATGLPLYFSAKKRLAAWDGEDETVSEAIEQKLSVCMWITSMSMVMGFLFAAGHFSGMMHGGAWMRPAHTFLGLGAFLFILTGSTIFQQKLVDMTKKLNPEKQGSVYDPKFHEKWLASCDEAERAIIGQCAMKAYQAVTFTCLALWTVFVLGGIHFDWGFLPVIPVCVVWGVNQSVYGYWAIRLSRPGSSSAM